MAIPIKVKGKKPQPNSFIIFQMADNLKIPKAENCKKESFQTMSELEILGEYINSTSNYSNKEFELLSTVRYDPNLSQGTAKFSKALSWKNTPDKGAFPIHLSEEDLASDKQSGETAVELDGITEEALEDIFFYRFLLLGEHLKRIHFTLNYFHWNTFEIDLPFMMDLLIKALPLGDEEGKDLTLKERMIKLYSKKDCYKMRFLIKKTGEVRCEAHPIQSQQSVSDSPNTSSNYFLSSLLSGFLEDQPTYTVYIYDTQISPSCFTSFKTTNRDHYTKAREQMADLHAGKKGPSEILLFNTSGELMEGSITNCYIRMYMGDNWSYTTPALSSGCLCGVMRNYLVTKRVVTETKKITIHQLRDGDEILLSNAIMGLVKGRIVKPDSLRLK